MYIYFFQRKQGRKNEKMKKQNKKKREVPSQVIAIFYQT